MDSREAKTVEEFIVADFERENAALNRVRAGRGGPSPLGPDARHHRRVVRPELLARPFVGLRDVSGRVRADGQDSMAELAKCAMEEIDVGRERRGVPPMMLPTPKQ